MKNLCLPPFFHSRVNRIILMLFIQILFLFDVVGQVTLPYEQDFSDMYDSTYTKSTNDVVGVPGLSKGDLWKLSYVVTIHEGRYSHLIGIDAGSSDRDSLRFKVDLSVYDASSDDIIIGFDVSSRLNQIWSVFVREGSSKPVIKVGEFDLGVRKSEIMPLISRAVSKKLLENGQNYSSQFEIIFTRTGKLGVYSTALECLVDRLYIDFAPEVDIDLSGFKTPQPKVVFDAQDKVSLEFTNRGKEVISTIPVKYEVRGVTDTMFYQEEFMVNLKPDSSIWMNSVVDFDLSKDSIYWIYAEVQVLGDMLTYNDRQGKVTFKPDVYKGGLPYEERFNANSNEQRRHFVPALRGLKGFSYLSENVEEGYLNSNGNGIHLGRIDDNPRDFLMLTMDLSAYSGKDVLLDFSYNYSYTSLNKFKTYIRGSENDDWLELYNLYSQNRNVRYLPITPILQNAGQELSETFQIQFYRGDGRSSSFSLSYIQVKERSQVDLAVFELSPTLKGGLDIDSTGIFKVSIANHGLLQAKDFVVQLAVESNNVKREMSEVVSLNSADTITVEFENTFDFTETGNYKVTAVASIENDTDSTNNSLSFTTYRAGVYEGDLPYFVDFSKPQPQKFTWKNGVIDDYQELSFNQKSSVSIIDTYGYRSDNQSIRLAVDDELVLTLDLSDIDTTQSVLLDFVLSTSVPLYSYLEPVLIRGGKEDDWKTLVLPKYPFNKNSDDLSSINTSWNRFVKLNLTDTLKKWKQNFSSTTQILFPGPNTDRYVMYDDIIVYKPQAINLELWDMKLPESFFDEPDSDEIRVRVINRGESIITNFDLLLKAINPVGDTALYTVPVEETSIASGDTLTFFFQNPVSMIEDSKYEYLISCKVAEDSFYYDDYLIGKITNRSVITEYPYVIDVPNVKDEPVRNSGEFESIKGWFIESGSDYMMTESHDFYYYGTKKTYKTIGTNHAYIYGGLQTYIWTFDLTDYSLEDSANASIYYDLSYFPTDNGSDDGLYVRGGIDDQWILVLKHQSGNLRYNSVKQTVDIPKYLKQNGQFFSDKTQLKVIAYNSYSRVRFNLYSFNMDVVRNGNYVPVDTTLNSISEHLPILVYPNPAKDYFLVRAHQDLLVIIYDVSGQIILQGNTNHQLDISSLKPAIYVGKVFGSEGNEMTFKLVKEE